MNIEKAKALMMQSLAMSETDLLLLKVASDNDMFVGALAKFAPVKEEMRAVLSFFAAMIAFQIPA